MSERQRKHESERWVCERERARARVCVHARERERKGARVREQDWLCVIEREHACAREIEVLAKWDTYAEYVRHIPRTNESRRTYAEFRGVCLVD